MRTLLADDLSSQSAAPQRVHKGELIKGPQAVAGEWGQMSINPDGPLCYCGQRGCVETYISGSGVEARYAERFGEKRSFAEIADDYEPGNPRPSK